MFLLFFVFAGCFLEAFFGRFLLGIFGCSRVFLEVFCLKWFFLRFRGYFLQSFWDCLCFVGVILEVFGLSKRPS